MGSLSPNLRVRDVSYHATDNDNHQVKLGTAELVRNYSNKSNLQVCLLKG